MNDKFLGEFEQHDSVIISQSPNQLENMKKHKPEDPIIIEGPIKAYLNEKETSVFVMRSENKIELDDRQKRNLKFDPKYTRLITNKGKLLIFLEFILSPFHMRQKIFSS